MGPGVVSQYWGELKANPMGRLACTIAFVSTLIIYAFTQIVAEYPTDLAKYPLGTDIGTFIHEDGRVTQHPLSGWLVFAWRGLVSIFGLASTHAFASKIPYALLGAINFVLIAQIFNLLFGQRRAWLYAMCGGFSLMIWFYASAPESYALTMVLYSAYVFAFLRCTHAATYRNGALAACVLFLAILNDISAPMLVALPVIYYGLRAVTDPVIRNIALMHAAAVILAIVFLIITTDFFGEYISMTRHYSPLKNAESGLVYDHGIVEPAVNYLFFSLAAPAAETTYANSLFPDYHGFFQPSLVDYFKSPFGIAFLVLYFAPLWFIRTSGLSRIILAFWAFMIARFVAILFFNPGEAILYTSVVAVPILATLFHLVERSEFKYKSYYGVLMLLTLVGSNAAFLFTPNALLA